MAKTIEKKVLVWGSACHFASLMGMLGIPFGHIIGPLVVWLVKRKEHPYIELQGKAALNFQISMTVYGIAASLFFFLLIGFVFLIFFVVIDLMLAVIAAMKALNGESFRYPLSIRFIK